MKNNRVIAKGSVSAQRVYKSKSCLVEDGTTYFADIIFGDIKKDLDGDEIPVNTLCKKINGMEADLEHANLYDRDDLSHGRCFTVVDSMFDGVQMIGTVKFDTGHDNFEEVWNLCSEGKFGASFEYLFENGDFTIKGLTGTMVGRNPRSKVINAYTQKR